MTTITMPSSLALVPSLEAAWQAVDSSFECFCLTAGIGAVERMLCEDAKQLAGAPALRRDSEGGLTMINPDYAAIIERRYAALVIVAHELGAARHRGATVEEIGVLNRLAFDA